jgi:hypothetical protein
MRDRLNGASRTSGTRSEFVIPVFGHKKQLGIDRRHGFIRSFAATDAARHNGLQLGRLLDPQNDRGRDDDNPCLALSHPEPGKP